MGTKYSRLLKTVNMAISGVLYAPVTFKDAHINELMAVCNGCGAAGAKFDFVPDRIWGTYIGHACNIHDWMYHEGRVAKDKRIADKWFRKNLMKLIKIEDKPYKPKFFMRIRALAYYAGVKYRGKKAFWKGKDKP